MITVVIATTALGANWARTRPGWTCGVPNHDYRPGVRSSTKFVISSPAIPLASRERAFPGGAGGPVLIPAALPNPPADETRGKLFQWPTETIAIEHCDVSRPAVQIHEDGKWTLYLLARQNPGFEPGNRGQGFVPTAHILRNKFQVFVRCFATRGAALGADASAVGHPCVAEIGPIEFWVERGEPQLVRRTGTWDCSCRSDAEAFARMDRIELQFSFQR